MTIEQLQKMIAHRGYTVDLVPQDKEEPRGYEVLLIRHKRNGIVTGVDWAVSPYEIERLRDDSILHMAMEERLSYLSKGQHHMVCLCGYPLLRSVEGKTTCWYVYRSVASGPDSAPIERCVKCGAVLNESVQEIDDAS